MQVRRKNSYQVNQRTGRHHVFKTAPEPALIFFIMIAAPDPHYIFNGENSNRDPVEITEKTHGIRIPLDGRHRFQHNRRHIQNNEYNDKYVDDLIPPVVTHYFRMQQTVDFLFGFVVHVPDGFAVLR